jgi:hypothetical protein
VHGNVLSQQDLGICMDLDIESLLAELRLMTYVR